MKRWADDHILLEALGHVAGVRQGKCFYLSTAVVRLAVQEWVDRLRENKVIAPAVERLLTDEPYRHEVYRAARRANPMARREREAAAMREEIRRDDRARDDAAQSAVDAAVASGKAIRFPRIKKP